MVVLVFSNSFFFYGQRITLLCLGILRLNASDVPLSHGGIPSNVNVGEFAVLLKQNVDR